MAIYHLSMKPISRGSGRSAVAAAAYRSGTKLTNERDGLTHDYTRKSGVEETEIVLPEGVDAEWARDREQLWNAAEMAEKRNDARVAREFEVALPHELNADQRLELVREFSQSVADTYGVAVDFAIHAPDEAMDERNHHAHILITTREVTANGLGEKSDLERENKWLKAHDKPTTDAQLKALRLEWEERTNQALALAGHDVRIDHRSHQERGLEIEPTQHVGVHATQMDRRGQSVERERLAEEARVRNADLIRQNPNQVLTLITGEKSVFDRTDIARTLHRYINEDASEYQSLFTTVMASDELVRLAVGPDGTRYSTRELVEVETRTASHVEAMAQRSDHTVADRYIERAIARQDEAIRRSVSSSLPEDVSAAERERSLKDVGMSDEQKDAVRHITGDAQIAVVVGFAGAGKSTLLSAAKEAWEAQGYTVHGAALAGKAVGGLEESAGIEGRTLASWDTRWKMGTSELGPGDVLVIDEAGMIGSRQMDRFVSEAERTGAKLVLVGDHEQLQAIGAGAPFRAIAERVGHASVEDIRRQRSDWQRDASKAFATQRTAQGLAAYIEHGHVHLKADQSEATTALVRDYVKDVEARPDGSRAAMAHRRVDVRELNNGIREELKARGHLKGEDVPFNTDDGQRNFTEGDRLVFLQNDREMGVKNGTLGTVEGIENNKLIVRPDGSQTDVQINASEYKAFDHGYATTIHKTQGATVDRAYVLASDTMDRHMTYVSMTRHRDDATLYAGQDQFDGHRDLTRSLSRSGSKETVLDYVDSSGRRHDTGQPVISTVATTGFAQRRGMNSDIIYPARQGAAPESVPEAVDGSQSEVRQERDRSVDAASAAQIKRDMFAGLKLPVTDINKDIGIDSERIPHKVWRTQKPERDLPFGGSRSPLEKAADRYARAYGDIQTMEKKGLPVLEGQKQALRHAEEALEKAQPGAASVMASGLEHAPGMRRAIKELTGEARTQALIKGLSQERQALADPAVRADRMVGRWKTLTEQHDRLRGWQHADARHALEQRMQETAREIARDPLMESHLRYRRKEFGLGREQSRDQSQESLSRELERKFQRGLERDRGIER
ncbi:Ti-type conjugative transfer relaxase TraA [Asticcacaulis excentricus]|uniref:Ti-type conjugative transfer relaxase TraA n=1 Tax=Asticcacaulis excentricus (strain ATCC 15261 / DSM 4724 / KCTC 12464 / NCIMB 9791 / VKM B-1370 / CB 48) TaxID=573065 RepID=E8RPW5_ASTEC|nr:Ti-type conjugative transfer relaxase TraA [Asticcacaulis excentricus]ADU13138.1 Ti-type conjugative transfer relaxase TraA [Asticcacaulis excentricus CB 48]